VAVIQAELMVVGYYFKCSGTSTINGTISANGVNPTANGGSGGSIYITTGSIIGNVPLLLMVVVVVGQMRWWEGVINFNFWGSTFSGYVGSVTAFGGTGGYNGAAGTVYEQTAAQSSNGGILIVNNNGTSTAYNSGVVTLMPASDTESVGSILFQARAFMRFLQRRR